MNNLHYITIKECDPDTRRGALSDMKIDNKNIKFFTDTILETSLIKALPDGTAIQAVFFRGSDAEIHLCAEFSNADQSGGSTPLSRGIFIEGDFDEAARLSASKFLRRSETLSLETAHETSRDGLLFVDSGGFAYVGKKHDQFKRITLVAMLSTAYVRSLEKKVMALSKAVRNTDDAATTIKLYEGMLKFNAGFYQRLPVKLQRHEVSKAWDAFGKSYRVDELRGELDAQLSAIAQWVAQKLAVSEVAREERRDKRFDKLVAVVTIILAVLSLVIAVIATPEDTLKEKIQWVSEGIDFIQHKLAEHRATIK